MLGQPGGAERAQRVLGDCASKPETFHLVSTISSCGSCFTIGETTPQDANVRLVK